MSYSNRHYEGERPLYGIHDEEISGITIGEGESGLKECGRLKIRDSRIEGKYPLWCADDITVENCTFTEGSRAAVWYDNKISFAGCRFEGMKAFREVKGLILKDCVLTAAEETLWHCSDIVADNCQISGGNGVFMNCSNVVLTNCRISSKYSFQYCKNVTIRNCILETKDAFWESSNILVYDSVIGGEYLAWYSDGLTMERCLVSGTQPLCYARNLVMKDCSMAPDADLAFEYSTVEADIRGHISSVKNPMSGHITADSIGEVITDENIKAPGDCIIRTK